MGQRFGVSSFVRDVTTAGTRVRLSDTAILTQQGIIKAKASNSGVIYVGGSNVSSSNGFQLAVNTSVSLGDILVAANRHEIDLSEVYLDCAVNGEGVEVLYQIQMSKDV